MGQARLTIGREGFDMTRATKVRRVWVFMIFIGVLTATGFSPCKAAAAEWPDHDITIIIAYNPGGGFDAVARLTAPYIQKYLPRRASVIVKNVPGAGTRIGTRELVKAKPDGLTISIFDPVTIAVMEVGGQVDWLDSKKLSWLAQLENLADMMVIGPKTGYKTPKDMTGKTVRFSATDDATVLRSAVFARSVKCTPRFVRYNGPGEAVLASLRGDLDAMSLSWSSGMRQIKASDNKMIALVVSSPVSGLNVPSLRDFSIDADELILDHPHFVAAPPGLSPEVRRLWEDTFAKVFKDPEWSASMDKLGYPISPIVAKEKLDANMAETLERMGKYKDILSSLDIIK